MNGNGRSAGLRVGLVVDVVEDQSVQAERAKPSDRRVGDLPRALAVGRRAAAG